MKNPTPYECRFCVHWLRDDNTTGWCQLQGNSKPATREPISGAHHMSTAGLVTDERAWCPAFRQRQIEDVWYPPEDV